MKKQILLFLSLFLFSQFTTAQISSLKWAKQQGGASTDQVKSLALDLSGNVFTTGIFSATADFDPSSSMFNLTSSGGYDGYVSKLDMNGDFQWAFKIGGAGQDFINDIATDDFGDVYVSGAFTQTVDFNPGTATNNLTSVASQDGFIAKYTSDGEFIWVKQLGGTSAVDAYSLTIDDVGNVYVTGFFYGTVDFDPGALTHNITAQSDLDGFVLKLDIDGNFIWVKHLKGDAEIYAIDIQLDNNQNIFVTGDFFQTINFEPGATQTSLTASPGFKDAFLVKYDNLGDFVWAKQFGGTGDVSGFSLTIDNNNNVYMAGDFKGTADFDPNAGTTHLSSLGNTDAYFAKYDNNGIIEWVKQIGGVDKAGIRSVFASYDDQIYVAGYFKGSVNFNLNGTANTKISNGQEDIFIAQYDENGVFIESNGFGSIGMDVAYAVVVDYNGFVYVGGDFMQTVDFNPGTATTSLVSKGVQDGFVIQLGDCNTTGIDIQNACGSYEWTNGITYTTSNYIARDTIPNSEGCDSIVTLNLEINDLALYSETYIECGFLILDGVTYTSSQTLADTFPGVALNGCDSIMTTVIVIHDFPDVSTTTNYSTITANVSGATYQWIDCGNGNTPITGETNSSFTATADGNYAVIISDGNCSATSTCVNLESVGLKDEKVSVFGVKIYPNPTKDILNIALSNANKDAFTVELLDALGKVISTQTLKSNSISVNIGSYHRGVYFVRVSNELETATYRVIKQ